MTADPDDTLTATLAALQEAGSVRGAAKLLGVSPKTVRNRRARLAERGMLPLAPVMPGYAIKSVANKAADGSWVRQVKEHGEPFRVPAGHAVKGVSALIDAEGRVIQEWRKTGRASVDITEAAKAAFAEYEGRAELIPPPTATDDDLMSVYPIADAHHGLMSWRPETGENYDLKISAARLEGCMNALVAQSPKSRRALLLNLGDYFHINDRTAQTPASKHLLDTDGRYFKVVATGVDLFRRMIDLTLERHEQVTVRCLPGNHDPDTSIILTIALAAFYKDEPRVTIEQSPSEFFFHRFGATLIGAHHGQRMSPERMAMAMATMRPEDWGAAKYRWFLYGHIHHERAKEVGDVRCESFQTLAAKDAYSAGSGYVSGQSVSSVTLHRERGEIGRHRVNVPPATRREAA